MAGPGTAPLVCAHSPGAAKRNQPPTSVDPITAARTVMPRMAPMERSSLGRPSRRARSESRAGPSEGSRRVLAQGFDCIGIGRAEADAEADDEEGKRESSRGIHAHAPKRASLAAAMAARGTGNANRAGDVRAICPSLRSPLVDVSDDSCPAHGRCQRNCGQPVDSTTLTR